MLIAFSMKGNIMMKVGISIAKEVFVEKVSILHGKGNPCDRKPDRKRKPCSCD